MKVLYSVICEDARIRSNGRMDIQGVFQQLQAGGFPAVQERLIFVAVLEWDQREEGEIPFQVELRGDQGNPLLGIRGETTVAPSPRDPTPPQTRLILPIQQVVFPVPGKYQFVLLQNGSETPLCPLYLLQT